MRVLFVFPDLAPDVTHYTGVVSYGVDLLSAVLKQDGHEVELLHLTALTERDDRVHWVWCEHQGRAVCSHIYFLVRGTLQGWQIYFDKCPRSLRVLPPGPSESRLLHG